MQERRRYPRTNGLVLVNYRIPELKIEGKTSAFDVSAEGTRITVNRELKLDTLVEIEIYLPGDSQPILAKGTVIWVQKVGAKGDSPVDFEKENFYTGLKFTIIDQKKRKRIIDYVQRKLKVS